MAKTVEWAKIASKLPWGTDVESDKRRKLLFRQFDPNGNGLLSLAEADKGLIELQLNLPKPVIMRAFQASKGVNQETKASNDDFVDYTEFRVFLLYIRQYMELWVMFEAIDSSKDHKITPDEFAAAAPAISKWGLQIADAATTFREIDHDRGGVILFDEFAHWAIKQRLKVEGSDNVERAGLGSGLISDSLKPAAGVKGSQRKAPAAAAATPQKQNIDWGRIAQKLPWGTDEKSTADRKLLFRTFDPNGNGLLSLAEADKGIIELGLGDVICKAVIMRAYQSAKAINQSGDKRQNDDYIDSGEFRMFLLYVRQYLELWVMFDAIDADKNKKIEAKEFAGAAALVEKWGFKIEDPAATFREIDADKGGCILFDEFAHWAIKKKLDLEDDDNAPDAGAGSGLIAKSQSTAAGAAAHAGGAKKAEQKAPATMKVDWKKVAEKLPWGTDEASALNRKRLFRQFDPNGNGLLSLAEADKGVVIDLQLGDVCSKQVIMRAFNAAKSVNQSGNKAQNDDYVDFSEFRMFLLYLRQYLELWVMFEAIDTNKDKRIEKAEFAAAVNLVSKWGFKIDNPDAIFAEIDQDGGGMILFDEFAHWAIQKKLDLEDDDDAPDAGAGSGLISGSPKPKAGVTAVKKSPTAVAPPATKAIDWADVAKKLPWGTDEESVKRRKKLFKVFDPNGNGLLSLAEVDKGVGEDLKMGDVICKAVIMRAFQASKAVNKSDSKAANDDYVDFTEFRTLLLYLRQYLELWVMFEAIDTNKDKRIDASEFAAAAKLVEKWGTTIKDPAEVFAEIDVDGGGMILFDEFADWAIRKQLDLPDDDDAENAGQGTGVSRTGPDIKVRGVTARKAAASPAARASPAKTPARPPVSKSPSPRPAPKPAPAPAARTPPPPARNKSPAPRAADKPAWGSTKSSEMKKAPPAPSKFGSPPKTEQKVSLGIKFEANADGAVGVTVVNPDSTASRAGLQVGDILASLAGQVISSKEEFKAILPSLQPGSTVDLLVKRGAEDVALKLAF